MRYGSDHNSVKIPWMPIMDASDPLAPNLTDSTLRDRRGQIDRDAI